MKVAVVGAGPAGLMAAASAAESGSEVTLLERNEKAGKKLYITGKGRCNVTNACSPRDFISHVVRNPKFLFRAIHAFSPDDTIRLLEENGTSTKVERGGRVFPRSDKASDVTAALVKNATRRGVTFIQAYVTDIAPENGGFIVTADGEKMRFDRVILACGGVSYPSTGSSGDGFRFAAALGHTVTPLVPALAPIAVAEDISPLIGLKPKNVRLTVSGGGVRESEFGELMFSERGIEGPIALTLSSKINRLPPGSLSLELDFKPALDRETLDKRILSDFSEEKNKIFANSLGKLLPKNAISYIIKRSGIAPDKRVNAITRAERQKLIDTIKALKFRVDGVGPIEAGIVTSGGVATAEVDPGTMESRLVPGLYFAGEMLDVDALTGGFNIQIALSTGYVAGLSAGKINAENRGEQK